MSNSPKYKKISFSNSIIKNERNNRKISIISRLNSDKRYKIHIKNRLLLREGKKLIKDSTENNSILKSISSYKEQYEKAKKENSNLQSSNKITNKIYKQDINKTFYNLIKIYRDKNYNTTEKNLNNVFKSSPLMIRRKEDINLFLGFKSEKNNNKYIRFIEKEKNIIKKLPNLLFENKTKLNSILSEGNIKKIKIPFKTLNIFKSENKMNPNEKKFISLFSLNNMKKMVKKYKNEIKFSKNVKNIMKSKGLNNLFLEKDSIPTQMINENYEKEIEDLMKEKDKSCFLEKLSNLNILYFSRNELEKVLKYYAKTFLRFNENQIKKMLISKTTKIDKELLIILNIFMKKNNKIQQKKKHHFLYNFELFNTIKEVDNQTFNLQKKLIENQTGD